MSTISCEKSSIAFHAFLTKKKIFRFPSASIPVYFEPMKILSCFFLIRNSTKWRRRRKKKKSVEIGVCFGCLLMGYIACWHVQRIIIKSERVNWNAFGSTLLLLLLHQQQHNFGFFSSLFFWPNGQHVEWPHSRHRVLLKCVLRTHWEFVTKKKDEIYFVKKIRSRQITYTMNGRWKNRPKLNARKCVVRRSKYTDKVLVRVSSFDKMKLNDLFSHSRYYCLIYVLCVAFIFIFFNFRFRLCLFFLVGQPIFIRHSFHTRSCAYAIIR